MEINGHTKLFALLGHPVGHSFSPGIHNPNFKNHGINAVYLAFDVPPENLKEAVDGLFALGAEGANITVPHKESIMQYLTEISEEAKLMGAVNTLIRGENGFRGENTDGPGFIKAIEEKNFGPAGKKVLILGAGGAARAVSVALAMAKAEEINFINRDKEKAIQISGMLKETTGCRSMVCDYKDIEMAAEFLQSADLVVNTTVLGMYPQTDLRPEINYDLFHKGQLVTDLIYNPEETAFLKEARGRGADTLNGYGMLYYQAELAFSFWTGKNFKD